MGGQDPVLAQEQADSRARQRGSEFLCLLKGSRLVALGKQSKMVVLEITVEEECVVRVCLVIFPYITRRARHTTTML